MGGMRRDATADRATIVAASQRILAGVSLRCEPGQLTVTALIVESGLRRDVVYQHVDLVNSYQGQLRARHTTRDAMTDLQRVNEALRDELDLVKGQLAAERRTTALLRRTVTELSIEAEQRRSADVVDFTERRRAPNRGHPS